MNNITGGAGVGDGGTGGGLSGTLDGGRLSQVSGCHRVDPPFPPPPVATLVQPLLTARDFSFFFPKRGRDQAWKLIWKRPRCFVLKKVKTSAGKQPKKREKEKKNN